MAGYLTFAIGLIASVLFVVGFGKFWFGGMAFTDPSQNDEVNARGAAHRDKWSHRFSAAWTILWPIGSVALLICLACGIFLAVT